MTGRRSLRLRLRDLAAAPVLAVAVLLVASACSTETTDDAGRDEPGPQQTTGSDGGERATSDGDEPATPDGEVAVSTTTTLPPRVPGVTTATGVEDLSAGDEAWEGIDATTVEITSSVDGSAQPATWVPPTGSGPQPVVVSLPSWSYGHEAAAAVPIARWVDSSGWGLIQPAARGASGTPESTGSDLVVADVLDAIDYATGEDGVDTGSVFLIGYSGGAMTALVVGGRHPERIAGVAAFSPIYDLVRWYDDMRGWNDVYADDVRRACGGDPLRDPQAHDDCRRRSPAAHLDGAREARLPIYLGQGDRDAVTFPDHARDAYDHARDHSLPESVDGVEHHFGSGDPAVVSARETGPVRYVEFEGEHDLVYHPALEWMAVLAAAGDGDP